jgi:hypothetical protein
MTVTASSRDPDGLLLQAQITSLTTQIASTSSALTKHSMSLKLDQLQRELVAHYLDTGRILAATVLSTLS